MPLHATCYRIYFTDKGKNVLEEDAPVCDTYIRQLENEGWKIMACSRWFNYVVVQHQNQLLEPPQVKYIKHWETVNSSSEARTASLSSFSTDPPTDAHRQWQLDTLGGKMLGSLGMNGSGIVIAVIDAGFTGANTSRAFNDIFKTGRVIETYDFIDKDSNVFHGSYHGSMVWSCIAGNLDNKPTGLATGASFILYRTEEELTETVADEDRWIEAVERAYLQGADIISSSVGFTTPLHKKTELDGNTLIAQAANKAVQKGMIVVQAAGNEWISAWKTLITPADAEGVITVAGIDKDGEQAYFSSVGPTADGRQKPDVTAPGICVVVKENDFIMGAGTSFAAPLVTGYLACQLQINKSFNKDSVMAHAGLYPYADYVFGYGVPYTGTPVYESVMDTIHADKTAGRIWVTGTQQNTRMMLKITSANGRMKFCKKIKVNWRKGYQVPTAGSVSEFHYHAVVGFDASDRWTVWYNGKVYEY